MLKTEGYKMFNGTMRISPKNAEFKPFEVTGIWLYRPDTECWYCNGHSYSENIVSVVEDNTK